MRNQRPIAARYIRKNGIIVVSLNSGLELRFSRELVPELRQAGRNDLATIEITPGGQGLHSPKLDADLYVPGVLGGVFGPNAKTR
jgi:hypothetical protein